MSDERVSMTERVTEDTKRSTTTAEAVHDDHDVQADDARRTKISPTDLAMARAIIDAALARRS
jgi:hypothetical protein